MRVLNLAGNACAHIWDLARHGANKVPSNKAL